MTGGSTSTARLPRSSTASRTTTPRRERLTHLSLPKQGLRVEQEVKEVEGEDEEVEVKEGEDEEEPQEVLEEVQEGGGEAALVLQGEQEVRQAIRDAPELEPVM